MDDEIGMLIIVLLAIAAAIAVVVGIWFVILVVAGPFVIGGLAIGLSAIFLYNYGKAVAFALFPEEFGVPGPAVLRPDLSSGSPEPALRQYFFGQAFVDYRSIVTEAFNTNLAVVRGQYVYGLGRWLFTGASEPDAPWPPFEPGWPLVVSIPCGLLILAGSLVSIAFAVSAFVVVGALHLGVVAGAAAISALLAVALRGVENVRLAIRRIRVSCPHPGCYESVGLPVYECTNSDCRRRHHKLVPGIYGILRRTCVCDTQLPTLFILGRHEVAAFCPTCDRRLPDRSGSARAVHIPVVGGPSAGKTMLMMSTMVNLERLGEAGKISFSFASDSDRREFAAAKSRLLAGGDVNKTVVELPRAFMVYIGAVGGATRLIYIYDPAGEYYQSTDQVQQQLYLRQATGLLFVVDPFSVASFVTGLRAEDEAAVADARPSAEDPASAYYRLLGSFRSMVGELGDMRLAVVLSKTDALERVRLPVGLPTGSDGPAVRGWLNAIGLGNLVRSMEHDLGDVGYYRVSARDSVSTRPAGVDSGVAEPVLWLLEQSGLDLRQSTIGPIEREFQPADAPPTPGTSSRL